MNSLMTADYNILSCKTLLLGNYVMDLICTSKRGAILVCEIVFIIDLCLNLVGNWWLQ